MEKPVSVDAYIEAAPKEAQVILNKLREIVKETVPEAEEMISYNVPFYKYYGQFVGFSVSKKHVSFGFSIGVLTEEERKHLEGKGYKLGKQTMQIQFGQEIPEDAIKGIIEKMLR